MPQPEQEARLLAKALSALNAPVGDEPELLHGNHANLYRWGGHAIRVSYDGSGPRAWDTTRRMWQAGLKVPECQLLLLESPAAAEVYGWVRSTGPVDMRELGAQLRLLHQQPAGRQLPKAEDVLIGSWEQRGMPSASIPRNLEEVISGSHKVLSEELSEQHRVVLHGDLKTENIIQSAGGTTLMGWELSCSGHAWWDLAHMVVDVRAFGQDESLLDLLFEGYGHDPREERTFESLCRIREAAATFSALRQSLYSEEWRAEAAIRLSYWSGEEQAWQRLTGPGAPFEGGAVPERRMSRVEQAARG